MLKLYKDFGDLNSHEINLRVAHGELYMYVDDVSTELVLNYYGEYAYPNKRSNADNYIDGFLKINLTDRNTGKITKIKYIHSCLTTTYVYNVEAFETNVSTEKELEEILTYVQDTLENNVVLTGLAVTKRYKNDNFTLFVITDKEMSDDISKNFNTKFGGRPQITGRHWFEDEEEDDLPYEEHEDLGADFSFLFFDVRYTSTIKSQLLQYILDEKYKDIFTIDPDDPWDMGYIFPSQALTHRYHQDGTNRCTLTLRLFAKDTEALKKINRDYLNEMRDDLLDFLNKIDTF